MTRLFRSKSCGVSSTLESSPTSPSLYLTNEDDDDEEEEEEDDEFEDDEFSGNNNRISKPFINGSGEREGWQQSPIVGIIIGVLRKSLVTCSVEREREEVCSSFEIGLPTEVRHLSHVTFDRFSGFHGLPPEFQPQVPIKPPSASASVFGVSAKSMQCSYDQRGNSVPTILLMMQKRLYSEGGLQAEGVFRINAENSQEEYVRNQLNKGLVPYGIDVHCLAGLIKAWFRELPTGVLDSVAPEQVMHCNTEDQCTELVKLLPPTEGAMLDWAINLMADVVRFEHLNKMNARNIAMVFAPNMTKMADPLTALIHAVQVMNLLKTLIVKTLREREESSAEEATLDPSCSESPSPCTTSEPLSSNLNTGLSREQTLDNFLRNDTLDRLEPDTEERFWKIQKKCGEVEEEYEGRVKCDDNGGSEGILERLWWRKGVRKLCSHPVFQFSKPLKKTSGETCV